MISPDEATAKAIAAAFGAFTIQVAPGIATCCTTYCELRDKDYFEAHDLPVYPPASQGGDWYTDIQPDQAWTGSKRPELLHHEGAMASAIYEKLKTCRGFLVAIIGHETQDFTVDFREREWFDAPGVVVRADLRRLVSSRLELEPFSAGYLGVPPR